MCNSQNIHKIPSATCQAVEKEGPLGDVLPYEWRNSIIRGDDQSFRANQLTITREDLASLRLAELVVTKNTANLRAIRDCLRAWSIAKINFMVDNVGPYERWTATLGHFEDLVNFIDYSICAAIRGNDFYELTGQCFGFYSSDILTRQISFVREALFLLMGDFESRFDTLSCPDHTKAFETITEFLTALLDNYQELEYVHASSRAS